MSKTPADKNRRVLVVDDNLSIHADFRKILSPATATTAALDATEMALFGCSTDAVRQIQFEVDSAYQGREGVLLVKTALERGLPYAMAFVDVRMPPGWDGVETTRKIWEVDPDIQIVLCTAYSDYSWDEMFEKPGHRDRLLILKKPFDTVEAFQLAHALTEKWWLHQQSRRKTEELESRVAERTRALQQTNRALQAEVVEHQRAKETLRESEEKFRQLADNGNGPELVQTVPAARAC
jgi:CheY-like chemotaxis protein